MSQKNLLPEARRKKMANIIRQHGAIQTKELAQALGTSTMTVRRDLKLLEKQNCLQTTWGGAVPLNFQAHDIPYANKATKKLAAKQAIAKAALELIADDTCIILDAGTTTLELAKLLIGRKVTVITNDLQIGLLLASAPHTSVHVTGGCIDPVSKACLDATTLECLKALRASLSFIGTNVWDITHGVTTSSTIKMQIKQQMMSSATHSVLLADSSKYGNFSTWQVTPLNGFHHIITDDGLTTGLCHQMQKEEIPIATVTLEQKEG